MILDFVFKTNDENNINLTMLTVSKGEIALIIANMHLKV